MRHDQRLWNSRHKELRTALSSSGEHERAIELFMFQHGVLHASELDVSLPWSFEDEVLSDMTEDQLRRIPVNCEHSVAWNLWHIARIEDVTMNMLVAGVPQLFFSEGWFERMKSGARNTGNAMNESAILELNNTIDLEELLAYRLAVGRRTREVVRQLSAEDLKRKVDPVRLQDVMDVGAVVEEARGLIDYWGNRNIAGLLLMPPTRHNCVHLNEAVRLKKRRR